MRRTSMIYILAAASALFAADALADSNPAESDTTRWLGDVTVTAIKQQSDISLLPTASTVVDAGNIERWNIDDVRGVSEIAPNFYVPAYGSRMTSSIYVRGIGSRMDQPAVGLTVDNVNILNKDNYDFDIDDIERIEVLRGPQSSLYGRNTMAGLINVYTLQPMKYQGSRVRATIGRGAEARLGVSHYMLIRPNLAMGFSGIFNFSDGFYKNHYNANKVGTEKGGNLRWKTQWQVSPTVALDNVATLSVSRQGGYPYELLGSDQINYNDTCFYKRNSFTDGLTVKWTQPGFSLSSITSVQYLDDNMTLDQDFLPINYFTLTQARREWTATQDLVMRGRKGCYSWVAGMFGFYKHTSMRAPVELKDDGIARLVTDRVNNNDHIPIRLECNDPSILLGSFFKTPTWGLAWYHQSSLDLGRVNLALGLRLDYEKATLDYTSLCNTGFTVFSKYGSPAAAGINYPINIDDRGRLSQDFLEFLPKFTVSYDLPMHSGSSVYASVGKGYKSGGFNTQMFSEVLQQRMMQTMMGAMGSTGRVSASDIDVDEMVSYKPEKSWNYEVGAHIGCADGRVMTDLALFYIDCRDQQLTTFPDETTTGRITTNAGRTRSFGAEAQIRFNPNRHWAVNLSYGYTNATFRRYMDGGVSYKGKHVPYVPSNTLFGSVSYTHWLSRGWSLSYNLRCRTTGRIYWDEANEYHQPVYALLGGSVTAKKSWISLEAWADNITATKYNTFFFTSMGNSFVQRGNPCTFGLTLRLEFASSASVK